MNANRTIAVLCALCALCALSALPTHARVFDVRHVGDDSSSTASPSTSPSSPSTAGTTDGTTTNAPTTYNPNHPYCLTCVGTERTNDRYQLIRGDDEVKQCNDHIYCDCKEHKQMECGGVFGPFLLFNPDKQECTMGFSCYDYLRKHPAPPAPTPTTPTSGSTTEQSTTTSPPASNPTTRSPTTKNPPTQSTASKAPNPSTTPGTTAKPSSAWANRATALTVVCLAAVAAL